MAKIEQVPPPLDLEVVAGDPLPLRLNITGGTVTNPTVTMKTNGGDAFSADPGVPQASMATSSQVLILWTAADTAALNTTTRPKTYLWSWSAVVDSADRYQLVARTLTVLPVGAARKYTPSPTELTINVGTEIALSLEIAGSSLRGNIDGGAFDEVFGGTDDIDGGLFTDTFTTTTYDGGTF